MLLILPHVHVTLTTLAIIQGSPGSIVRFLVERGAGAVMEGVGVSHMMYANDLTLLANNNSNDLQVVWSNWNRYSNDKGLTVNVIKSHVVFFRSQSDTGFHVLKMGDTPLQIVLAYKYMGVLSNHSGKMSCSTDFDARPLMAGINRVDEMADESCVLGRPHAMLWVFEAFGVPACL